MSWNYRVIRRVEGQHDSVEPVFTIAEVFYGDDGKVKSWTADPMWACGSDPADLRADMEMMLKAFDRPVLEESATTLVEWPESACGGQK